MKIDGRIPEGYVLLCGCDQAFVVPRLDLSLQCPACGHLALGADLAVDYHLRRGGRSEAALPAGDALPA